MSLTIEHTHVDGTVLDGTSRGDGTAEIIKPLGWRWGRNIGMWYLPRTRDAAPKRAAIEATADALRAAGHEVEVSVDTSPVDRGAAEERRAERFAERAEQLTARAVREQAKSDAHEAAARRLSEHIPFGQPVLLGHHSQARAERDGRRVRGHFDASVAHQHRADEAQRAATEARAATGARNNPVTVANRIQRLEAEERRLERLIDPVHEGTDPDWLGRMLDRLADTRADLTYWREVRGEQLADGTATNYSRETVRAGDLVKVNGSWYPVVRANAKTVTVHTGLSDQKAPWHKVQDHRAT